MVTFEALNSRSDKLTIEEVLEDRRPFLIPLVKALTRCANQQRINVLGPPRLSVLEFAELKV